MKYWYYVDSNGNEWGPFDDAERQQIESYPDDGDTYSWVEDTETAAV